MADSGVEAASNDLVHTFVIEQFRNVTGSSQDVALSILEACNWNLELAINMHVDSIENEPMVTNQNENPTASSSAQNSDYVRPPIAPVRQVLVEDDYTPAYRPRRTPNSVFDGFRDFQAEASWQEEIQSSSSSSGANGEDDAGFNRRNKRRTLQELYRPPLDLLFRGTLEAAREEGTTKNKWLLVNVQNVQEFACQVLNRDVWSNTAVKEIVQEHFVFWQIYHDSSEGQRYTQFYNVSSYPHLALLDPRTGEKLRSWGSLDAHSFSEQITEFLAQHPSPDGSLPDAIVPEPSGSKTKAPRIEENPYEQSEDEQLKAAIAASLREMQQASNTYEDDDDDDIVCLESEEDDSNPQTQSSAPTEPAIEEHWENFLGVDQEKSSQLVIRYPDGSREQKDFPADSQLKALLLYVAHKGFVQSDYDLVTNFPKRTLNTLELSDSLSDVGLFPRETIYVQQKS